ncbi:MAG: L-serine ammonia-lyase, iron-sulfur-dependent, subunit alpha [Culturomica sp.]|jgi:L-cysteine desulfidase|nr:L-serine ammonia-lyase, iron-sulfur-dependent, subunit alpha [Culturomica sp.]
MCQATNEQLIAILQEEAIPALGCTEPVACGLVCARCREELGGIPEQIEVWVSGNIYKNGMGVGIPGTGMYGLPIAAAVGAVCGRSEYGLEVLKDVSAGDNLPKAKELEAKGAVRVYMKEEAPDKLYAEAVCSRGTDTVKAIIAYAHTNFLLVEKNGKIIFQKESGSSAKESHKRPELSVERIWRFIHEIETEKIAFVLNGAEMNKAISEEGLKSEYGLQIGKTLLENIEKGLLEDDLLNNALIRATAASDARMDGCEKPVMTNSGSGNQGITVYLPVIVAAERFGSSREQLIRALALSNLIAAHIHYYMGHLSALCGILIAATGSASAITYLMGGNYEQVVNTIKTMCSNLTGMMCDGAKQGCALKVYSGVSAAVQAAMLSMRGIKTHNDGIVEENVEQTIRNIGIIGTAGMEQTDKTILHIMRNKK